MTFFGILFICARVVSFAARALRARAANDSTRAQINNIPEKSYVIPLLMVNHFCVLDWYANITKTCSRLYVEQSR